MILYPNGIIFLCENIGMNPFLPTLYKSINHCKKDLIEFGRSYTVNSPVLLLVANSLGLARTPHTPTCQSGD